MPNLIIILIGLVIALSISHTSAKKNERETRETIAKMDPKPEHAWVSGEPSGGAWMLSFIVIVVAVLLAMPR